MAYGFTSIVKIPLAQEIAIVVCNGNLTTQFNDLGDGVFYFNLTDLFDNLVILLQNQYGGNVTYVRTTDATYIYYTLTWSDILIDPATDVNGSPVSITVTFDDGFNSIKYSGALCGEVTPPADLTICTECRQSRQQACADTYLITAGLTEGDTYYVTITDRNNNLYIQSIVADVDGNLTIDALSSEFPSGFWLSESGTKSIIVYEDVNRTIVADLTVGANVYTCMILTLQYIYTTT